MRKTTIKLSRNDKAAAEVAAAITAGAVVLAYDALAGRETTAGPYIEAVDRGNRFAVVAWGVGRASAPQGGTLPFETAANAAWCFVSRVGSTRALEAARKAARKVAA